jgi:hypothetical protein
MQLEINDTRGCPKGSASLSQKNHGFLHALTLARIERSRQAGRQKEFGRHARQPSQALTLCCQDKVKLKKKTGERERRGRLNFAAHPCRISPKRMERPNQARQEN